MRETIPEWAEIDLWLDDDNALEFIHWKDDPEPYGAHWWHRANTETGWHMGGFQWCKPDPIIQGAVWELNSMEPLDVSPSLLCHTCGAHGFIKQGRWVQV